MNHSCTHLLKVSTVCVALLLGLPAVAFSDSNEPLCPQDSVEGVIDCVLKLRQQEEEPVPVEPVEDLLQRCAGKTGVECWELYGGELEAKATEASQKRDGMVKQTESDAKKRAKEDTGGKMNASTADGLTSAGKDVYSPLLANLGIAGVNESDGNLKFEFNPSILDLGIFQGSLAVTMRDPAVFEPLTKAIPEKQRKDKVAELDKGFSDFDSIDFAVSLAVESSSGNHHWSFGRDLSDYQWLLSDAASELNGKYFFDFEAKEDAFLEFLGSRAIKGKTVPGEGSEADHDPSVMSRAQAQQLASELLRLNELEQEAEAKFQADLEEMGFFPVAALVANQPQLSFQVESAKRTDDTGPEFLKYSTEFNWSRVSVNGFCRWAAGKYPDKSCGAAAIGGANDFLEEKGWDKDEIDLDKFLSTRLEFSLSASYSDVESFSTNVDLADDQVLRFAVGDYTKWVGSAKLGRILRLDKDGKDQSRIDGSLSYEDLSGTTMPAFLTEGKDEGSTPELVEMPTPTRLVVNVTYTERLSENLVASLGVVWANEPEFLGDVDEKSANFGLKWSWKKEE